MTLSEELLALVLAVLWELKPSDVIPSYNPSFLVVISMISSVSVLVYCLQLRTMVDKEISVEGDLGTQTPGETETLELMV